mmetsp:Transcript_73788/g.149782  ORF Transcript_73788/g.149782 Transcript_73788/m.149782 type:complete len:251 (+) Transcript_73788:64-816(+)
MGFDTTSVASRPSTAQSRVSAASSSTAAKGPLAPLKKAERLSGECTCQPAREKYKKMEVKPGQILGVCTCAHRVNRNIYSREVMEALNYRGGAVWERYVKKAAEKEDADDGEAAPESKSLLDLLHKEPKEELRQVKKPLSKAEAKAAAEEGAKAPEELTYNKRFNMDNASAPKITARILDLITTQLSKVMEKKEEANEEKVITKKDFVNACISSNLEGIGKKDLETMFDAVDKDKSGSIDVSEWAAKVKG